MSASTAPVAAVDAPRPGQLPEPRHLIDERAGPSRRGSASFGAGDSRRRGDARPARCATRQAGRCSRHWRVWTTMPGPPIPYSQGYRALARTGAWCKLCWRHSRSGRAPCGSGVACNPCRSYNAPRCTVETDAPDPQSVQALSRPLSGQRRRARTGDGANAPTQHGRRRCQRRRRRGGCCSPGIRGCCKRLRCRPLDRRSRYR